MEAESFFTIYKLWWCLVYNLMMIGFVTALVAITDTFKSANLL